VFCHRAASLQATAAAAASGGPVAGAATSLASLAFALAGAKVIFGLAVVSNSFAEASTSLKRTTSMMTTATGRRTRTVIATMVEPYQFSQSRALPYQFSQSRALPFSPQVWVK